jgi:hypothetical protein
MHNRAYVGKKGARHASFCQFSDLQGAIVVQTCLEPLTAFHIRKNRSHICLLYVSNVSTAICD